MRPHTSEYTTIIATELAWLLGSWAFSFALLGLFLGFNRLLAGPLDIQMHNTYFVLSLGYAVFPVFVFVATIVTVIRGIVARFKLASINTVLGLLGIVWVSLLMLLFTLLKGVH